MKKFLNHILIAVKSSPLNNAHVAKLDKSFFYPIKEYKMEEHNNVHSSAIEHWESIITKNTGDSDKDKSNKIKDINKVKSEDSSQEQHLEKVVPTSQSSDIAKSKSKTRKKKKKL